MPSAPAELSSIASILDQITGRITVMAEGASEAHEDELARELFAIERSLAGARRRVEQLARPRR